MDHFGIGAAMKALILTYGLSARRTGRTTSLVDSLKTGDRVVFAEPRESVRVQRLCRERGVEIECLVIDTRDPQRLFEHGSLSGEGRTIFDHTWVERFYALAIDKAAEAIDELERATSGYGAPHRETRRRAEELAKWRL